MKCFSLRRWCGLTFRRWTAVGVKIWARLKLIGIDALPSRKQLCHQVRMAGFRQWYRTHIAVKLTTVSYVYEGNFGTVGHFQLALQHLRQIFRLPDMHCLQSRSAFPSISQLSSKLISFVDCETASSKNTMNKELFFITCAVYQLFDLEVESTTKYEHTNFFGRLYNDTEVFSYEASLCVCQQCASYYARHAWTSRQKKRGFLHHSHECQLSRDDIPCCDVGQQNSDCYGQLS